MIFFKLKDYIVELIGLSRKQKFHGRSLLPFFNGEQMEELPVYMHTTPHVKITSDDKIGIRTSKYKYFRSNNPGENVNLYDLKNDPQENYNIAENNLEIVKKMENILQNLTSKTISNNEEISREETKRLEIELRKLGYIEEDENLTYEEVNSGK